MIVVDDNSPDGTGRIARKMGVTVITRPAKMGIASAYYDGFLAALDYQPSYIVQIDAGLTHNPRDIPRLLEKAREGYSLVIGSRKFGYGKRAMISRTAAMMMKLRGVNMPDVTSGFRCWRRSLLWAATREPFKAQGFAFQLETLYRARKAMMAAVPIEYKLTNSTFKASILVEALKVWATLDS